MNLLHFTPSRHGAKAELYEGMITVEIMPEFQTTKGREAMYGWWQVCIGLRYWSRDKHYEGKKGVYFPPGQDGLEKAKEVAEQLIRKMVWDMCRRVNEVKGEGEKG